MQENNRSFFFDIENPSNDVLENYSHPIVDSEFKSDSPVQSIHLKSNVEGFYRPSPNFSIVTDGIEVTLDIQVDPYGSASQGYYCSTPTPLVITKDSRFLVKKLPPNTTISVTFNLNNP